MPYIRFFTGTVQYYYNYVLVCSSSTESIFWVASSCHYSRNAGLIAVSRRCTLSQIAWWDLPFDWICEITFWLNIIPVNRRVTCELIIHFQLEIKMNSITIFTTCLQILVISWLWVDLDGQNLAHRVLVKNEWNVFLYYQRKIFSLAGH